MSPRSSIEKALQILLSYSHQHSVRKVTELSEELMIPKSTTSRIMSTLAKSGFLVKTHGSEGYFLGPEVHRLGGIILSRMRLYQEITPSLNELVYESNETVHIVQLNEYEVIYLNKYLSPYYSQIETGIGLHQPAYATSSGKVLLADKSSKFIQSMFENSIIVKHTESTITSYIDFMEVIEQVKKEGHAISIGEYNPANMSYAVPIFDEHGKVICAISMVLPVSRRPKIKREQYLISLMKKASEDATDRLMFSDDEYFQIDLNN